MSSGTKRLVEDISSFFLGEEGKHLYDVILVSSDGHQFPSSRLHLAARSTFFSKLLFSEFQEANQAMVSVEMELPTLKAVMEYLFTGAVSCDVRGGRAEVCRLNDLLSAADYIGSDAMVEDCFKCIFTLIEMNCDLACTVVEKLYGNSEMAIPEEFTARLLARIRQNPKQYLLVPTCLKNVVGHSGSLDSQSGERDVEQLGVLYLSSKALLELVKAEKVLAGVADEYWFQVIYFWATCGLPFYSAKRVIASDDAEDLYESVALQQKAMEEKEERWQKAREAVDYLDSSAMRPEFLQQVVEIAGLMSLRKLCEGYKAHAIMSLPKVAHSLLCDECIEDGMEPQVEL